LWPLQDFGAACHTPLDPAAEALGAARGAIGGQDARGALEVHHVNGDPMDNRIANTIPLCRDCHHAATFSGI
jgi:hypothetical protein